MREPTNGHRLTLAHALGLYPAMTSRTPTLYEQDFHAWTEEQARLLRAGQSMAADLEHIAEEIETLGASERRELESRLKVLLLHLLKWRHQPDARSSGWAGTIAEQRDQLDSLLRQSPSLRRLVPEYMGYAYPKARRSAALETGLDRGAFPETCPFAGTDVLDPDYLPEPTGPADRPAPPSSGK